MIEQRLEDFCDILSEEISDSQPLSLSLDTTPQEIPLQSSRPSKYSGQKGIFRSIEEIDPKYRHVFTYPYFNFVQSKVIDDALYSNKSIVVSAPTGSGKTVVFEMAIVQLLMELEDKRYTGDFKIIYMAPVKAVCTERITEWHSKFANLGHLCILVTGDTDIEFPHLQPYRIIITTPEKWDMLTRRWKDHRSLVEVVKLFLIDEVHILNDEIRGPVLEAVVSRMKTIETSAQTTHRIEKVKAEHQGLNVQSLETPPRIRFVAVSATVSNPKDVAEWLGTNELPAVYYKFGDECRPVRLKRVVEGYPCSKGASIFKFDITLSYKLWPIIQKYHNGKPTLIFCNTRKSVVMTAEILSREVTVNFDPEQKASLTALAVTIKNKKVQSLILCGVGCHHAGLLYEERMNIEQAFRNRELPILITTTTLAMGVNLPAHLVIIKNTQQYMNGAYQEYSISTVLQMVGRAGRPQFDTEATAVIMTRLQDKARYHSLVGGSEPLQSYLHKRLPENLNSEAALGTVGDVAQCVQWLNSTFLSVRAMRDPKRYLSLPPTAPEDLICKKLEDLCQKAITGLSSAGLISMDEVSCIRATEAGRLMSIFYLDLETMKLIMKLEGTESLDRLLWLICESHELSDMHLRVDERRCLNALNRNNAATTIRFPMKGKINSRQMKLNCIIQAALGCLSIPDPSLNQEAMKIMRIANRICKCLVSYVTRPNLISQNPKFYSTVLNSLILAKCISAGLWENSPYVSRQLKGIGPTFSSLLASAGKINFMMLEESHPRDLERIMNKGPPAGNVIRKQISLLPKYNLTMTPVNGAMVRCQLTLLNQAHLSENMEDLTAGASHKCYVIVGDSENQLLYFSTFKDSDLINVYDGCMSFNVTRKNSDEHKIIAHCISSSLVGIDEKCEYTFIDFNPRIELNMTDQYHSASQVLEKENPVIQTSVTDFFKERKRKVSNIDAMRPTEKKKRDYKLMSSVKRLKESFGKTAEKIKMDFNKKREITQNLLFNLANTGLHLNDGSCSTTAPSLASVHENKKQILENTIFEELDKNDDYHVIDDNHVNSVLDEIENEIKDKNINSCLLEEKINLFQIHKQSQNFYKIDSVKCNRIIGSYHNKNILKHNKKLKDNYSFLHLLEKKNNKNEENDSEILKKNGFSEAVKCNLQKYLQQTQDANNLKNYIQDIIESPRKIEKQKPPIEHSDMEIDELFQQSDDFNDNLLNHHINPISEPLRQNENNCNEPQTNVDNLTNNVDEPLSPSLETRITNPPNESNFMTNQLILKINNSNEENTEVSDGIKGTAGSINSLLDYKKDDVANFESTLDILQLNNLDVSVDKAVSAVDKTMAPKIQNYLNSTVKRISESNNFKKPILTDNVENVRKYSFSQSEILKIYTKNVAKQEVHIISKLNFNVSEIVFKKQASSSIVNMNNKCDNVKILPVPAFPCESVCTQTQDTNIYNNPTTSENITCNIEGHKLPPIRYVYNPSYDYGAKTTVQECALDKNNHNEQTSMNIGNNKTLLHDEEIKLKIHKNNRPDDKEKNVKDILSKYSYIIKKKENKDESKRLINCTLLNNKNTKENITRCTRKYKIKDLDKMQIVLPQSLMIEKERSVFPKKNTQMSKLIEDTNGEADYERPITLLNTEISKPIHDYSAIGKISNDEDNEEISPELLITEPMLSEFASYPEYDTNQAILNPKTLLECLNKGDNDDIIAPPPEFCDDNLCHDYSDQDELDMEKITPHYENLHLRYEPEIYETSNVLKNNFVTDLTPTKEIETWIFSQDEDKINLLNDCEPTTQSRHHVKNQRNTNNYRTYFNSRQAKLSHFKFKPKNILKK